MARRTLGVILPDDAPIDYEWLRLEPWLAARGLGTITVRMERTPATGVHDDDSLFACGDFDMLAERARRLGAAGAAAVLWACTSGSFIGGAAWARDQQARMAIAAGVPATSTTLALVAAARALGADEVDLIASYPPAVTAALVATLEDNGLCVRQRRALDCLTSDESHRLDLAAELARTDDAGPGPARPLLIPDTAINTLDLVARLEAAAGRPVITANQASLWQALALMGEAADPVDAGSLFAAVPAAA